MEKKKILILVGLALILVALFLFLILPKIFSSQKSTSEISRPEVSSEELKNIQVPEPNESSENPNLAVPHQVVLSNPKAENHLRSFQIKGENKALTPSEIRVYQNDIVSIELVAVDNDYDLKIEGYNIFQKATKGTKKTLQFQAVNSGKFGIFCKACSKNPSGILIVVPK